MRTFAYHRPESTADAVALLAGAEEGRPLSGGMTLLPAMKMRLAAPSAIVDLSAIPGLSGITAGDGVLTIGAMTRAQCSAFSSTGAR